MADVAVILAAAGRSVRFADGSRKKPFVELKGRAVWLRSADHFVNRDDVLQTIIAVAPDDREWFHKKYLADMALMDIEVVDGGTTRAETVRNALARVDATADLVAVHDAVRPLLTTKWVDQIFDAARSTGAAIPGIPVTSTLKRVSSDHRIEQTVSRENLWQAQTPQVFYRQLLLDAFAYSNDLHITDEAGVVECFGHSVSIVEGSLMNLKITTQSDLRMAEAVLGVLPRDRTLRSLHPFDDEGPRLP